MNCKEDIILVIFGKITLIITSIQCIKIVENNI